MLSSQFNNDMLKLYRQGLSKCPALVKNITKLKFCDCVALGTKVVELPVGKVKGKKQRGLYGHQFFSFEGIPYGKPPIGELRFKAPQPAEPWLGEELDCQRERDIPMQLDRKTGNAIGSEDCLYLNVYAKHFDSCQAALPVLVYIYGGAFRAGGAIRQKYAPDYLMRENIVYVIFNYRLCALGFLSLASPELEVPGNAGLQDQLLALKWINQYISHFNGDAKNITLFGESAGAASVHFMMCLPQAENLFHKAVMMSGSMLNPWAQAKEPQVNCCRLALQTGGGCDGDEPSEAAILKHLRELPASELLQHSLYSFKDRCLGHLHPFVPGLEEYDSSSGLLRLPYIKLMRSAWSRDVPLLLGGTSFEGLVMYPFVKADSFFMLDLLRHQPALMLPYELYQNLSEEEREEKAALLLRFHYGLRGISKENVMQALDLFSYKLFWHGLHRVVLSRLEHAKAATFLYRFDFDSPKFNAMRFKLCGHDIKYGVCHADDLAYIFRRQGVEELASDSPEFRTIQRMVGILTTFARTGDPNCPETAEEKWLPATKKQRFMAFNISEKLEFQTQPEKQGLEVWNQLYAKDLI